MLISFQWQRFILPGESVWWLGEEGYCGQTGHPTLVAPLGCCCHQTEPRQVRGVHECPGRCCARLQQGGHDAPGPGGQEWQPWAVRQVFGQGDDGLPQASPNPVVYQAHYPWGCGKCDIDPGMNFMNKKQTYWIHGYGFNCTRLRYQLDLVLKINVRSLGVTTFSNYWNVI